jgi:hypothetical protein
LCNLAQRHFCYITKISKQHCCLFHVRRQRRETGNCDYFVAWLRTSPAFRWVSGPLRLPCTAMESWSSTLFGRSRPTSSSLDISCPPIPNVAVEYISLWFMDAACHCRDYLPSWVGNHPLSVARFGVYQSDRWCDSSSMLGPLVVLFGASYCMRNGRLSMKMPPNSAAHSEPLKQRTLSFPSSRRPGGRER